MSSLSLSSSLPLSLSSSLSKTLYQSLPGSPPLPPFSSQIPTPSSITAASYSAFKQPLLPFPSPSIRFPCSCLAHKAVQSHLHNRILPTSAGTTSYSHASTKAVQSDLHKQILPMSTGMPFINSSHTSISSTMSHESVQLEPSYKTHILSTSLSNDAHIPPLSSFTSLHSLHPPYRCLSFRSAFSFSLTPTTESLPYKTLYSLQFSKRFSSSESYIPTPSLNALPSFSFSSSLPTATLKTFPSRSSSLSSSQSHLPTPPLETLSSASSYPYSTHFPSPPLEMFSSFPSHLYSSHFPSLSPKTLSPSSPLSHLPTPSLKNVFSTSTRSSLPADFPTHSLKTRSLSSSSSSTDALSFTSSISSRSHENCRKCQTPTLCSVLTLDVSQRYKITVDVLSQHHSANQPQSIILLSEEELESGKSYMKIVSIASEILINYRISPLKGACACREKLVLKKKYVFVIRCALYYSNRGPSLLAHFYL